MRRRKAVCFPYKEVVCVHFKVYSSESRSKPKSEMEALPLSHWDYATFLLLRPIAASLFTLSLLFIGWFMAWKLVLVHVPLVREIFGLQKKPAKPNPFGRRRFTQFYNRINTKTSSSEW